MEKVIKIVALLLLVFFFGEVSAQESSVIRKGLVRAQLTISPSYMFANRQSYFYLHGNLEGYVSPKISISGEGYYSLGKISPGGNTFDFNHSLFFGASWHFTKNNHDVYVGLQPGLSFTKLNASENALSVTSMGVNPLFSTVVGYNFYLNKIFHFFIQTRAVAGQHNYDMLTNLSELRFSAGLGFNIETIHE